VTQLSYQIPISGEPNSSADPKVHDALQEILTVVNGELGSDNFPNAAIAGAKLAAPEAWREVGATGQPAFQNSWANLGGSSTAAFFKDLSGVVHLKGMVTLGTAASIFTLPVGYRPLQDARFIEADNVNSTMVMVMATGLVLPTVAKTGGGWIALEGIHFRAEQ
jgi:hypothetical protein